MKTVPFLIALSITSCAVMIVVDYFLGAQAEFQKAYSVIERLAGEDQPTASFLVATRVRASGELAGVLAVNMISGAILTILIKIGMRMRKDAG